MLNDCRVGQHAGRSRAARKAFLSGDRCPDARGNYDHRRASKDFGGKDGTRNQDRGRTYAIGLWGDLPYSDLQATLGYQLIADMNKQDLEFTVHDGDLKSAAAYPAPSRQPPAATRCTSRPRISEGSERAGHVHAGRQ
jgi:hypothetical protein